MSLRRAVVTVTAEAVVVTETTRMLRPESIDPAGILDEAGQYRGLVANALDTCVHWGCESAAREKKEHALLRFAGRA